MIALQCLVLAFLALAAVAVVATRNPVKQAIVLSFFGLLLAILFVLFQAPDVALSEIVVGVVVVPLMSLLVLSKVKDARVRRRKGLNRP